MKKILRILAIALCAATFVSSCYNMLNPAIANTDLALLLLFLSLLVVGMFLLVTKVSEKSLSKLTLFGNRNSFWIAFSLLFISLVFIFIGTFYWDFYSLPFILGHFSIIAILYLSNQYYNKKNSGKGQIVS